MSTYERVTYRPEGGRARTIYLQNPTELTIFGAAHLTGIEVDSEAEEVHGPKFDERRVIVTLDLVTSRVPMTMNNTYAILEPA